MKSTNPQTKAYPKAGPNTTRGGASNQGRTVTPQPGLKDVNAAQGPRVGVASRPGKRADFLAGKESANAVAAVIQRAYGARKIADNVDPKYEGISPNTKPRSRPR